MIQNVVPYKYSALDNNEENTKAKIVFTDFFCFNIKGHHHHLHTFEYLPLLPL